MPSRLHHYRDLLESALKQDYCLLSVRMMWELIKQGQLASEKKYLILRHDVDCSLPVAKKMWEIERRLECTSSFYFRLSTIDVEFMQQIESSGGEASYHYEEIATFAKQHGIRRKESIVKALPQIRDVFASNLKALRNSTGLPMTVVAAHGDFVNRAIGLQNTEILAESNLRNALNVDLEVYDASFMSHVVKRFADTHYPTFWKPENPITDIAHGTKIVYLLTHPNHWYAMRWHNACKAASRCVTGVRYKMMSQHD